MRVSPYLYIYIYILRMTCVHASTGVETARPCPVVFSVCHGIQIVYCQRHTCWCRLSSGWAITFCRCRLLQTQVLTPCYAGNLGCLLCSTHTHTRAHTHTHTRSSFIYIARYFFGFFIYLVVSFFVSSCLSLFLYLVLSFLLSFFIY